MTLGTEAISNVYLALCLQPTVFYLVAEISAFHMFRNVKNGEFSESLAGVRTPTG